MTRAQEARSSSGTKIRRDGARAGVQLFLLLLFSMAPQIGFAFKAAFEGSLVSNNPTDPPTAIVLNFESNIAGIRGSIRMGGLGATQKALTGLEAHGTCDLRSDIGGSRTLKMRGECSRTAQIFEGTYTITSVNYSRQSGLFRLTQPKAEKNGRQPGEDDAMTHRFSGPTPARCANANIACLVGCPRGDYNTELLCVNRCKGKLNACKAGGGSTDWSMPSSSDDQ